MISTHRSRQAAELAARIRAATDAVVARAAACTSEQWRAVCVGEGWTVGAVVRHIAWGWEPELECLPAFLEGAPWPEIMVADGLLAQTNIAQGAAWAATEQTETIAYLRRNGELVARTVAALTDEELNRTSQPPWSRRAWTTAEWVEGVLIWHPLAHLDSIRATLDS